MDIVQETELKALKIIHEELFNRFKYKTDKKQFNLDEYWVLPDLSGKKFTGDCEDFALACRQQCRFHGIKSRLVICLTEEDEGHCVLECSGYILDNRYPKLMTREELEKDGYQWYYISGFYPYDDWHKIVED